MLDTHATPASLHEHFQRSVLPHLHDAHRLARWLLRDDHDAQDVVQEAYLAAFRFFGNFHEDNARAWILTIVRNTCYSWLRRKRSVEPADPFDEESHSLDERGEPIDSGAWNPERLCLRSLLRERIAQALNRLPVVCREVLVLREIEGMSYREIAATAGVPLGTVMSRLARARSLLRGQLADVGC